MTVTTFKHEKMLRIRWWIVKTISNKELYPQLHILNGRYIVIFFRKTTRIILLVKQRKF